MPYKAFRQHNLTPSIISVDAKRTSAGATQIFELETGGTALANSVAIADTFCSSRRDAVGARACVGDAFGVVVAHPPADVATRHLAAYAVGFGIRYSARCAGHMHISDIQ